MSCDTQIVEIVVALGFFGLVGTTLWKLISFAQDTIKGD